MTFFRIRSSQPSKFTIAANRLQEPRRAEQGAREGGGRPARAQLGHPAAIHHRQHLQDDRDRLPHLGQQSKGDSNPVKSHSTHSVQS